MRVYDKFKDYYVYFKSIGIGMRIQNKSKD